MYICKHCDRPAEWRWTDDDGNETSLICQRCMETLDRYRFQRLRQFAPLPTTIGEPKPPQTFVEFVNEWLDANLAAMAGKKVGRA